MKNFLFSIICILLVFTSCDNTSQEPSQNNDSDVNEFIGRWIYDDPEGPFCYLSDYITGDFNDQYADLSSAYHVYMRQGDYTKAQELKREMDALKEDSKDAYMGLSTAVEITGNTIKYGDAYVYLNAASSKNLWASGNVWFLVDFSSGSQMLDYDFFNMGVFVENWRTYRYTIEDGVLYFNNGKECMFINGDKLIWENNGDFESMDQLLQALRKG